MSVILPRMLTKEAVDNLHERTRKQILNPLNTNLVLVVAEIFVKRRLVFWLAKLSLPKIFITPHRNLRDPRVLCIHQRSVFLYIFFINHRHQLYAYGVWYCRQAYNRKGV